MGVVQVWAFPSDIYSHRRSRGRESLVLHQPVDVMLSTVITSGDLKNVRYAQQSLLSVPVRHDLGRRGEAAERTVSVSVFNISTLSEKYI